MTDGSTPYDGMVAKGADVPGPVRGAVALEVVVPALDEAVRIGPTLDALVQALADCGLSSGIVVVDNGSVDGTAAVAAAHGTDAIRVHVVSCPRKGKGFAVRAGVLGGSSTWVAFMDADLATDLAALPVALAALKAGNAVVIGSRALPGSDVRVRHSGLRRLGAAMFRRSVAAVVPGVSDSQCGFKFFDGPLAREVFGEVVDGGFAFDVEVLARCQQRGHVVHEIPVRWQDKPGSTFSPRRDGLSSFYQVWQIARRTGWSRSHRVSATTRDPEPATGT